MRPVYTPAAEDRNDAATPLARRPPTVHVKDTGSQTPGTRPAGGFAPFSNPTIRWAIATALVVTAIALRLHGLTRHDLWIDEANTVRIARLGPSEMVTALGVDSGAPLYYAVLGVWMRLWGDSETAVRSLSVLFGVLLVLATGRLARRLAGSRAGWGAAWLMATTPMAVQFSQETRMYTLLPLLAALAVESLLVFLETGSRAALAAHAAWLLAALYTHNWGLFMLPAAAAAVAIHPRARSRDWMLAAGAIVLLYLPWVPVLASQMGSGSYKFIRGVTQPPAWQLPVRSLVLFASGVGTGGITPGSLIGARGGALAGAGWGVLIVLSLVRVGWGWSRVDRRPSPVDRPRSWVALALTGIVPLLGAALVGVIGPPVYLLGRYEILVLPLWLALVAASASTLLSGRLWFGLLALWTLALAIGSYRFTGSIERFDLTRTMAREVAARLRPGDRVVFTWLYRPGMEYYLRRAGGHHEFASFPPDAARHQGWYDEADYSPDDPALIAAARSFCPKAGSRTWVVTAVDTRTCSRLIRELEGCARLSQPFLDSKPPLVGVVLAEASDPLVGRPAGGVIESDPR